MTDPSDPAPEPTPSVPETQGPASASSSRRNLIVLIAAVLIAGLVGGVVGGFVMNRVTGNDGAEETSAAAPAQSGSPTVEEIEGANVRLCTEYASVIKSIPPEIKSGIQVLAGVNGLRWALADNPDASPEIAGAIEDLVTNYKALLASIGNTTPQGLNQPPTYDRAVAQQAVDRVLEVCQLSSP